MSGSALPAREAYRLWAPSYAAETAVSLLEESAVPHVTPTLAGRALLDVGCGVGRRLPHDRRARLVVGVDLVPEMLAQHRVPASLAAADVCALPIRGGTFDVVWCRLVLGHVQDIAAAYVELARVAARAATLIVTDFHPAARAAGHERTFRDAHGERHRIEHHDHGIDDHIAHALRAGWRPVERLDLAVGPRIRPFYERAGVIDLYERQVGLALVMLLAFTR